MTLGWASVFAAASTLVKIMSGFVSNKFLAVTIGPMGLALIGQFNNFMNIALAFSCGGISTGVTKYVAEYSADASVKESFISSAICITATFSSVVALLSLVFRTELSIYCFHDSSFALVFVVFSLLVSFFSLGNLYYAILTGEKEIKKMTLVNSIGSVVGLCVTVSFAYWWGVIGAIVALMVSPCIVFFFAIMWFPLRDWIRLNVVFRGPNLKSISLLSKFSLMTVASALTIPVVQMWLRDQIVVNLSWESAGHWQAVCRVSDIYLLVVTTSLNLYYLPRLSEIKDLSELLQEVRRGYLFLVPLLLIGMSCIFFFREGIITLLFSPQFLPMKELFGFQLLGDLFRILSWLLGYLLVAKAMTIWYIFCEVFFSFFQAVICKILMQNYGLVGISMGYFSCYFIFLIFLIFLCRKTIFKNS